ncbi:MAG TPA: aminopeptidase P family protein [Bacteroidales bacterium]|nr:aminopeptidase P family protein [Bacteroidales bacterium]
MFKTEVYKQRRNALKTKIKSGIGLFLGNNEMPMNYAGNTFHYRQDSTFLYFFALDMPGLAGVIDFDEGKDYIFGNDVDMEDIIWMGPQPLMKDNALKAGVNHVHSFGELDSFLKNAIEKKREIHFIPQYRHDNQILLEKLTGIKIADQKNRSSLSLIKAIIALRNVKDQYEIEELEKAAAIGYEMHVTAMKMAKPGISEREIAGTIEGIALARGAGVSFPIILSQNGETLHNHDHSQVLQAGRMMITDAGAETILHYASDYTRTVPVGGKFTQRQKEIYQIVLDANNAVTAAVKPGVTYQSIHLMAARVIASGLKALGLMQGDVDEAVSAGAHAMFFPHGLGHMMGMDVHDMENYGEDYVGYDEETKRIQQFGTAYLRLGRKLQPGYVLTNEPGIYFIPALIQQWKDEGKFRQFINYSKAESYIGFGGIRLEDDLLVTQNGCRLIGKRIPVTIEEVESTMKE